MANSVELVLGTAQLARPYGILPGKETARESEQIEMIRIAEARELVAIDTSPVYGGAEKVIGASKTRLEIHTKCHPNLPVEESLEISKNALGRESLDVVYLQESLQQGGRAKNKVMQLAEHLGGGVQAIGVSIYEFEEYLAALETPEVEVIQVPMNILDRRFADTELLHQAAELGKRVYARSAFLQGLLVAEEVDIPVFLSPLKPQLNRFQVVSELTGVSRIGLALMYLKQFEDLSGIIVGARNPKELDFSVSEFALSAKSDALDLVEEIEAAPWDLVDPRKWSA